MKDHPLCLTLSICILIISIPLFLRSITLTFSTPSKTPTPRLQKAYLLIPEYIETSTHRSIDEMVKNKTMIDTQKPFH